MKSQKYFSASTRGFYASDVHGNKMPKDAVAISDEQYQDVHSKLVTGHKLGSDEQGCPIAVEPPLPTSEQLLAQNQYQAKHNLQASDVVILRAYEDGEPVPAEWAAYRRALREVIAGTHAELPAPPQK